MVVTASQADTLIIAIWAATVLFGFVLGTARTTKIMIAIPAAALAANSFGNFFERIFLSSDSFLDGLALFNLSNTEETLVLFKVIAFALLAVLITTKGAFEVLMAKPVRSGLSMGVNTLFGFFTGGLVVSVLVIFISGLSFTNAPAVAETVNTLYQDSNLIKVMLDYQDFWFAAPFVVLVAWSLFSGRIEDALE